MEVLTGGWEIFLFGGVFIRFGKKKKKKKKETSVQRYLFFFFGCLILCFFDLSNLVSYSPGEGRRERGRVLVIIALPCISTPDGTSHYYGFALYKYPISVRFRAIDKKSEVTGGASYKHLLNPPRSPLISCRLRLKLT